MANFFTRSYTKEGKGVSKDGPQKKRFFLFFEICGRKFWSIVLVGLIFLLFCIPVVTFGPACCGLALVLRNFAREEHAFVWADFWRGFKENFKQGLVVGLLNLAAFGVTGFASWYYFKEMQSTEWMLILFAISLLCLIFEIFMSFYAYLMIVTFTLKTSKLIKNAFLFSLIGIRINILTLVCVLLMLALSVFLFTLMPALLLLIPLFFIPFIAFIIVFNSYGPVKQYLIDPQMEKANAEKSDDEGEDEERIFSDKLLND